MIEKLEKIISEEVLTLLQNIFLNYGPIGMLVVIIFIIIIDPDRIEKIRSQIIKPIFSLFGILSKQYVASTVGSKTTELIKYNLGKILPSARGIKVVVKWVSSSSDPVLREDGTVILRMEDSQDQTRNILIATKATFPKILCPTIRKNVDKEIFEAIDLALLKRLSEDIGQHALPVFQKYFLEPEMDQNATVSERFQQLVEIDNNGFLVPIFFQELDMLGAKLYLQGILSEKSNEVVKFIEFLQNIASRELGDEVELVYLSGDFKVALILLAKSWKAETEGLTPYIKRINTNLAKGCDSIYIVAFKSAFDFFEKVMKAADANQKLIKQSVLKIRTRDYSDDGIDDFIKIGYLDRVKVGTSDIFSQALKSMEIVAGDRVTGEVIDVAVNHAIVGVGGVIGFLSKEEASWISCDDCRRKFKEKEDVVCVVKEIDLDREVLILSKKFEEEDPWLQGVPELGDKINIDIFGKYANGLLGLYDERLEIFIPKDEVSWCSVGPGYEEIYIGNAYKVLITNMDAEEHIIFGGIKQLLPDPWKDIRNSYPSGTKLRAKIKLISKQGVEMDLGNGLNGLLLKRSLVIAGYEYADYESTFIVGQSLDVAIYKINPKKRFITLDLQRNMNKRKSG